VGLAVPLVAKFGAPGAALAWTVRVALDAALLFGACAWRGLVSVRSLAPGSLPRSVAALLVLGLLLVLASAEGGLPRLLLALAAVGFFHAAAWACVLDSGEREFVTAAAVRVLVRMKGTAKHD